jgi:hypothetical protein
MSKRIIMTLVLSTFLMAASAYGEQTLNDKVDKESYALA